jgi:hypothetical protein
VSVSEVGFGPGGIPIEAAYAAIRAWCQAHVDDPMPVRGPSAASRQLVAVLPEPSVASELEMRAVLGELITGNLAWAYRKTDGLHPMAAYAHAGLEHAGVTTEIRDPDEREQLRTSPIWPFLFTTRYW